jgi:hypothetical protein
MLAAAGPPACAPRRQRHGQHRAIADKLEALRDIGRQRAIKRERTTIGANTRAPGAARSCAVAEKYSLKTPPAASAPGH